MSRKKKTSEVDGVDGRNIKNDAKPFSMECQKSIAKHAYNAFSAISAFIPWFDAVTRVIDEILSIQEDTEYNSETCLILIERVDNVSPAVRSLRRQKETNEKKFQNRAFNRTFVRFHKVLIDIREFIKDVSQLNGLRKFTYAGEIKKKCNRLLQSFESVCQDLQFNIIITIEAREREQRILDEDVIKTQKKLEKMIQMQGGKIDLIYEQVYQMIKKANKGEYIISDVPFIKVCDIAEPGRRNSPGNRGKVCKKVYKTIPVAFKRVKIPNDMESTRRFSKAQLAILNQIQASPRIIKFYGLTRADGEDIMVMEWAEHGNLKELYENDRSMGWQTKLKIVHDICDGLVFLQACTIYHHDIRCENILVVEDGGYKAKIANFHLSRKTDQDTNPINNLNDVVRWLAPEKLNPDKEVKYSFACEVFSFGMLIWELSFQKVPYENMSFNDICIHVRKNKREELNFGLNSMSFITKTFSKIIKAAWNGVPTLRPKISDILLDLQDVLEKNSPKLYPTQASGDNQSQLELPQSFGSGNSDKTDDYEDDPNLENISIPLLEEGKRAHKLKDFSTAFNVFKIHAELDDPVAKYWKGVYLLEGHAGEKNIPEAIKLFKEAADKNNSDAQLRYAFIKLQAKCFEEFVEYLIKSADNNNATAMFNLGDIYYHGKYNIKQDKKKGKKYLELAALKDQPKALKMLGEINAVHDAD
ncbi:4969_t:CDS:2 [Acaulospora morrowiae]|uniref:4969_t:CDS:1 n=1 Tax=Acaulospora morrowiae TaxID=94023 RepID=A0A9N9F6S3_9GLOM|nr:4969_t:CDS:2 [Acaulospora morrowiae]